MMVGAGVGLVVLLVLLVAWRVRRGGDFSAFERQGRRL